MAAYLDRVRPAKSQIYERDGLPVLYVRTEERNGTTEHLFVQTHGRAVWTFWLPEDSDLSEFTLLNDTAGREEANVWLREAERLDREKEALMTVVRRAVSLLPETAANEIRMDYARATGRA